MISYANLYVSVNKLRGAEGERAGGGGDVILKKHTNERCIVNNIKVVVGQLRKRAANEQE